MDEFYSGEDTEKRLVAVAYRAADSILRSTKYLLPSVGQELLGLFTLDTLWGLCLLAAAWFIISVVSGPLGIAVNVLFLAYGLYSAWGTIEQTYERFRDWFWGFWEAQSESDLDKAGAHFAKGVVQGGVFLLELLLTHKTLRYASGKLVKRYPPPEKLRQRFEKESRKRSDEDVSRKRSEESRKASEESRKRSEDEPHRDRTKLAAESQEKARHKLQHLRRTLSVMGGAELGDDVHKHSNAVGEALLVGLGLLAGAGLITLAAVAASDHKRSRR